MTRLSRLLCLVPVISLAACGSTHAPVHTVAYVDLDRFMGDWFVIACIPTSIEHDAYNAIESYRWAGNRQVATTFRFNKGAFDGPTKIYKPTGYVSDDPSNAVWGMQFIWPVKADYRVMYLSEDYTQTVIGRNKRDYVWIMARTPAIADTDYNALLELIADQGYDTAKLRRVPQQHSETGVQQP